jgi:hypothetical protein
MLRKLLNERKIFEERSQSVNATASQSGPKATGTDKSIQDIQRIKHQMYMPICNPFFLARQYTNKRLFKQKLEWKVLNIRCYCTADGGPAPKANQTEKLHEGTTVNFQLKKRMSLRALINSKHR